MARKRAKSEVAEMADKISELKAKVREINSVTRRANEAKLRPLLLEIRHLMAKRALKRAEAAFSRYILKGAQLRLGLPEEEATKPAADATSLFSEQDPKEIATQ